MYVHICTCVWIIVHICTYVYACACMHVCAFYSMIILMLILALRWKRINTHQASQYLLHSCCVQSLVPSVGKQRMAPVHRRNFQDRVHLNKRFEAIEQDTR